MSRAPRSRRSPILRRNTEGPRAVARWYRTKCGWSKQETRETLGKSRKYPVVSPRRALTPEQQGTFAKAVGELLANTRAIATMLIFLPLTGLRIAEACSLLWSNIERRARPPAMMVFGKGRKWRRVPLPPDAVKLLDGWMPRAAPHADRVFAGCTPRSVQAAMRKLGKTHPSLKGVTPHVLRHTFATNAVRACMDPKALQAALGHDSLKTTMQYLHGLGFRH